MLELLAAPYLPIGVSTSTTRLLCDSEPVLSSSRANDPVLNMRPKLAWRVACPALVILLAAGLDLSDWRRLLVGCAMFALSLLPSRSFIRVDNGVLYQRGVLRWYPPLDLDRLRSVKMIGWTSKFPHRELDFASDDGAARSIAPVWWSNWRPLVTLIARTVSSQAVDESSHHGWKFILDSRTERYLSGFL
jgi:hypothetical protein